MPTPPSPKQTTAIHLAVQDRAHLTLPAYRGPNGIDAFHWVLLLTPEPPSSEPQASLYLDVSDIPLDPASSGPLGPGAPWFFRQHWAVPTQDPRLVLTARVGRMEGLPDEAFVEDVRHHCRVPEVGGKGNCMTWVRSTVDFLSTTRTLDRIMDIEGVFGKTREEGLRRFDDGVVERDRGVVLDLCEGSDGSS